jgi:hypothetical protein
VQWKTAAQDEFPREGQTVAFELSPGDQWQDVSIDLPVSGRTAIVRLYLPADRGPVEIESLQYVSGDSPRPIRAWNFRTP